MYLHFNYGGCYEIYMGEKYARAKVAQKEEEEREKEEESRERERERKILTEVKLKLKSTVFSFDSSKIGLILIRKT